LEIFGYVVLENHLHFIAQGSALNNSITRFKSFTARQTIDLLTKRNEQGLLQQLRDAKLAHKTDREYQLWQEGSHPQQIQNDEMMIQKLEYIHNNPLRRGYVDRPEHWRYSSARNYLSLPGLVEVVTNWR
jgi:putative transposase